MLWNLLYIGLLLAAAPVIAYRAIRQNRYRRGVRQKLFGLSPADAQRATAGRPCHWLHGVSVGEINLLPKLVKQLESADPSTPIVISTSTDAGYDLAVELFGRDRVFFAPLDFTWAVRRTLRSLRCNSLTLVELEIWPNLVAAAKRSGATVGIINGRLSENSCRGYRRAALLTRPTFGKIDRVLCGTDGDAKRFKRCGTPEHRTSVTGSLKFDNAPTDAGDPAVMRLRHLAGVDPWHRVWIAGSTAAGEESMVLSIYNRVRIDHPELRLIIVPRHPRRFDNVADDIRSAGLIVRRQTQTTDPPPSDWQTDTVFLGDTIGHLRHWWGVAHIATVGGSFGTRGGQNMIEPAGYGAAVSFGPHTRNFRDITRLLLTAGAATRVADEPELETFVRRCLQNPAAAQTMGTRAANLVRSHQGSLQKTVQTLTEKAA